MDDSNTNGVIFGVAVGAPGGDDMKDPAQRAGRTNPGDPGNKQPDDSDNDSTVIDLTDSGNQETEHAGNIRIAHVTNLWEAYTTTIDLLFARKIIWLSAGIKQQQRSQEGGMPPLLCSSTN